MMERRDRYGRLIGELDALQIRDEYLPDPLPGEAANDNAERRQPDCPLPEGA